MTHQYRNNELRHIELTHGDFQIGMRWKRQLRQSLDGNTGSAKRYVATVESIINLVEEDTNLSKYSRNCSANMWYLFHMFVQRISHNQHQMRVLFTVKYLWLTKACFTHGDLITLITGSYKIPVIQQRAIQQRISVNLWEEFSVTY